MHTDRYTLALAMLDGDRAARQVLADMLEEQDERGLAQWAREGRKDKRRTLEFVVMLLACRPGIGLAAKFVGKVCGPIGESLVSPAQNWARQRKVVAAAVAALQLAQREITKGLHENTDYHRRGRYWEHYHEFSTAIACADLLINALQLATQAERFAASGDAARATARDFDARVVVKRVVEICSQRPMAGNGSMRYESNLIWLTEQLRQLLKTLIESEDDLWPR